MNKWAPTLFALPVALMGCTTIAGTTLDKQYYDAAEKIAILENLPEQPYEELGYIKEHFDTVFTGSYIQMLMRREAYQRYGDKVDALTNYSTKVVMSSSFEDFLSLFTKKQVRAVAIAFKE